MNTATTTPTATQTAYPWRATLRTILAALVGLATAWALIIEALGLDPGIPWVATSLAVAGAVTRVLALPAVTDWLERFLPWLAPAPREQAAAVELADGSAVTGVLPTSAELTEDERENLASLAAALDEGDPGRTALERLLE